MARNIIVALRMSPAGLAPGPEGNYLERARSLCGRGEALGGRLVGWGGALVAMAFSEGSIQDAVVLASSILKERVPAERAWSSAIAEGDIEAHGFDGRHANLAWGPVLVSAAALARVASPGEVLIDAAVPALQGRLAVGEERSGIESGKRVGGFRLDLEHPWTGGARPPTRSGPLADRIRKLAGGATRAPPRPSPSRVFAALARGPRGDGRRAPASRRSRSA